MNYIVHYIDSGTNRMEIAHFTAYHEMRNFITKITNDGVTWYKVKNDHGENVSIEKE